MQEVPHAESFVSIQRLECIQRCQPFVSFPDHIVLLSISSSASAVKSLETRILEMEKSFHRFKDDIGSSIALLHSSRVFPTDVSMTTSPSSRNSEAFTRQFSEQTPSDSSIPEVSDRTIKGISWESNNAEDSQLQLTTIRPDRDHGFHTDGFGELDPDLSGHLR